MVSTARMPSRILRLTSLSPEIVEAILDGNEPKGLSLAKLRKKLPLIWSEQLGLTTMPQVVHVTRVLRGNSYGKGR